MADINPNIPMSFNPRPLGPDIGAVIGQANALTQLQQQQQQIQQQNALRGILGRPGAFDAMGNVSPDARTQVMGIDPATGLKLMQNQNSLQLQQAQLQDRQLKRQRDLFDMFEPARSAAMEAYTKTPGDEAAKLAAGQKVWTDMSDPIENGGGMSDAEKARRPKAFNPTQFAAVSETWQKLDHQRRQEQSQDRRDAQAGTVASVDNEGNPIFLRPNVPAGQPKAVYASNGTAVPEDKLQGAHKMGTGRTPVSAEELEATKRIVTQKMEQELGRPLNLNDPVERARFDKAVQDAQDARKVNVAADRTTATVKARDAANMGVPETPEQKESKAAEAATGRPLNQIIPGYGATAAKAREEARANAIQKIMDDTGMTASQAGVELAQRSIEFLTGRKSDAQLGTMRGATVAAVKQLDYNVDQVREDLKKLPSSDLSPVINAIARGVEKWTGDPAYSALFFHMQAVAMESARILSGGQASIAQLSEGARKEAERWASVNMTPASFEAVAKAVQEEGKARIKSFDEARSEQRLGEKKPTETTPPATSTATPAVVPVITNDAAGRSTFEKMPAHTQFKAPDGNTYWKGGPPPGGATASTAAPATKEAAPPAPVATPPAAPAASPAATIPTPPTGVPAGSAYSASRKMWRSPDGKLFDAQGKPVAAP